MTLVHKAKYTYKRTEIFTKGENISKKIFILDTNYLILSHACDFDSLLI